MHTRCNGSILLGTIAICVALVVTEPDINLKKPFGPKMCEHYCNQIVGCASYIYRTSDLFCHPTQAKSPNQNSGMGIYHINAIKDNKRMDAEDTEKCKKDWKMFHTRGGIIQCRPFLSSHTILPTIGEEREVGMTRILILSRSSRALRQQLYIDKNSVVEYPFLRNIEITAVGYISSQRKLVVSSAIPQMLFFTPIDEKKKTIIKTKAIIHAIAIDDHKQLVFMKVRQPERCVCVMSTDGKNITSLFSTVNICHVSMFFSGGLIVDHKRSLIYVLCPNDKILHFTYQGVSKGKIGDRPGLHFVFFLDMQGYDLYYQDRNLYLHKLSLSDHTITTIHTLKVPALNTMLNVGNILYMHAGWGGHLILVNMNDMGTTTKIKIRANFGIVMCLVT